MSIKITIFSVNDWLGSRLSGKKAVVRWDAEKSQAGQGLCPRGGSVLAFSLPGAQRALSQDLRLHINLLQFSIHHFCHLYLLFLPRLPHIIFILLYYINTK